MTSAKDIMDKKYEELEMDAPISKAFPMFKNNEGIVLTDGKRYQGVMVKRNALRGKIQPKTKVAKFKQNVARLAPDDPLDKIAWLMLESDSYVLPVIGEHEKVMGVVKAEDVIKEAAKAKMGAENISKYMNFPVITIEPDEPVAKAMRIFKQEDISRLPVVSDNRLHGIITMEDTISRIIHPEHREGGTGMYDDTSKYGGYIDEKKEYLDLPVEGIMSETVTVMKSNKSIKELTEKMKEFNFRGMLLGTEEELDGVITKRDLLEPIARSEVIEPLIIQFSGDLDRLSGFSKETARRQIRETFEKYMDFLKNAYVHVRMKQHDETRKNMHLIHCKIRLSTPGGRGMFIASDEGWGFVDAINKTTEAIEKQIKKDKIR